MWNRLGVGMFGSWGRVLAAGMLIAVLGGVVALHSARRTPARAASPDTAHAPVNPQQLRAVYAGLPLAFEANEGQTDPQVKFLARGGKYSLFLTADQAVFALQSSSAKSPKTSVIRMQLAAANPSAAVAGATLLPGKSNYFIGNDPAKWRRNVPQFAQVRYANIYRGVDLVYYGNQGRLEYDFEVAPGIDPKEIAIQLSGMDHLKLSKGNLVLASSGGDLVLKAPQVYQQIGNKRRQVPGRFVLRGGHQVGFEVGAYDRSRTLVIDPVLSYSTYLGGSGNEACSVITGGAPIAGCPAVAADAAANIYVAGSTTSADFPNPTAPPTLAGTANVFVAKINPSLSGAAQLSFSTFIGGDGIDTPAGIAVDSAFAVIVAGTTSSSNFPAGTGFQTTPKSSGNHVFVTKLDSSGTNVYSTYLSSSGTDTASGVALDPTGKIYVEGVTTSTQGDFPVTSTALQLKALANQQFFLSKINPATSGSSSLAYSTYFGGGNPANGIAVGGGITVDTSSNVYITGGTTFLNTQNSPQSTGGNDFPILNAAQTCLGSPNNPALCPTSGSTVTAPDIFVAKINPAASVGAQLIYSTYLGGAGADIGYGVAVDSGGDAYVTGSTTSTDIIIPTVQVEFQQCLDNPTTFDPANPQTCDTSATARDAFVAKFSAVSTNTGLTILQYFSYLGGSGDDVGTAITTDSQSGAFVTGWTASSDFHTTASPIQGASGGGMDAFEARLDTSATSTSSSAAVFSTYLGGSGNDAGTSIAMDRTGNTYVAGETTSGNFPTVNPFAAALNGPSDAFVSTLAPTLNLAITETASPSPVGVGNATKFTYTITNNGEPISGVTFSDSFSTSQVSAVSVTPSTGSCGTSTIATISCLLGQIPSTSATSTAITVTVSATPSVPGPLSDAGTFIVAGNNQVFKPIQPAVATVTDFSVAVSPATATVPAGVPATFAVTLTPTGTFPETVSLSCTGLPSPGSCSFSNTVPNLSNGPVSRTLVISTTARTTTTTQLWHRGEFYAMWFPVSGITLLGLGGISRKRRVLVALLFGAFLTLILAQAGCGSSGSSTTTTGTPAGTYNVTITAAAGVSHTTVIELVVQ